MSVQDMIQNLINQVKNDPAGIKGITGVFQFDIRGDEGGTYQVKLANDDIEFTEGMPYEASSVFQMSDDHFKKLFQGKLNPTMAVMSGKVKIKGDLSQAMALQNVVKYYK